MIYVYSKSDCGPCVLVKNELERRGLKKEIDWKEKMIDEKDEYMRELTDLGFMSVPLVTKNNEVLFNGFRPDIMNKVFK